MADKKLDENGRWRNISVCFRASEDEVDAINEAVFLSGLTKREYLIRRALNREVTVVRSPKTYIALKDKMDEIIRELHRIKSSGECSDKFLETMKYVTYIYTQTKED